MSIRRAPHQTSYAVIHNDALRDPTLSFKARGILALLLSMPDDWRVSDRWLSEQGPDGRDAVQTGLRELESANYLRRTRNKDKRGQWIHHSTVYESPNQSDSPWLDFPATDEPSTENPAIEEVPSEEVPNNEVPTSSSLARSNGKSAKPFTEDESFAAFWAVYPRKKAKGAARKAWKNAVKKGCAEEIVAGAAALANSGTEAQFTPYPATWLNAEQWTDEPDQDSYLLMLSRLVAESRENEQTAIEA